MAKRVRRTKEQIEADNKAKEPIVVEVVETADKLIEVVEKTKGILLVALGHSQYGNMAYNLATSIKFSNPNTLIHLVYTDSSVSQFNDFEPFTSRELCNSEYYMVGQKIAYLKAKTHLYDLSPFDETIFIDADSLVFGGKSMDAIFESFKAVDITFENYGLANEKLMWFNLDEAKAVYNFEHPVYEVRSQFMYFKKTDAVKNFFEVVKDVFLNPKVNSFVFDGHIPDELAFNIATGLTGIKPHKDGYKALYWEYSDTRLNEAKTWGNVVQNFIGISIGGNRISNKINEAYHNIIKSQSKGIWYRIYPKASWNKNRHKV